MANSKRRCALQSCKIHFRRETGIVKGLKAFCSEDHQVAYAMEAGKKLRVRKEKTESVRRKKEYKADRLPHQLKLTKNVFNEMIRLLDKGKLCPTCNEPLVDGRYDAGHVRTVASCPQLRFHACACFGQCRACNGSGTIRKRTRKPQEVVSELYKAWVLKTFGQERYDWLYGPHETVNFTCAQLQEMRAVFAAERTRLKKGLAASKNWRSLDGLSGD
ncbi:MAG: recombination protein NinG [Pseudomonadota bacterium]